jgi:hypothetical protein
VAVIYQVKVKNKTFRLSQKDFFFCKVEKIDVGIKWACLADMSRNIKILVDSLEILR